MRVIRAASPVFKQYRSVVPVSKLSFAVAHRTMSNLNIESTDIKTAPGVQLDSQQKTIIGSVLDLFKGRPTLEKLQLWADDGIFEDPITVARGRKQYEPQWYGLQSAFSEIEQLHHEVKSSGNPVVLDMKTRYVVKGINKEQIISSVIEISTGTDGKITHVKDKWDGELPEGGIRDVFRKLNSVTVPKLVSVPKDAAEDQERLKNN